MRLGSAGVVQQKCCSALFLVSARSCFRFLHRSLIPNKIRRPLLASFSLCYPQSCKPLLFLLRCQFKMSSI